MPNLPTLRVSENRHFLVTEAGQPFFYLGDTAWELFHRLTREEADHFLQVRSEQGFNAIQAVVLAEFDGLKKPNAYGHVPLTDLDPTKPNDDYFQHVDYVVNKAASLGMYTAMLPTWGDKVNRGGFGGPEIFTPENARVYGEYLGNRYKDKPIIWVLGGDRRLETDKHLLIYRALAEGLRQGDGGRHLITFHPPGGQGSATFVHGEPWLDFNMLQSGHTGRDQKNWNMVSYDYARLPTKPVIDAEPCYEDHPVMYNPPGGGWMPIPPGDQWFDQYDVRKAAYRSVFAGSCGHTYGCHDVWQMLDTSRDPAVNHARTPWREAIQLPGVQQMRHMKNLMLSRPFLSRVPDSTLVLNPDEERAHATRNDDGSYAFIYLRKSAPVVADLKKISGNLVNAWWYDPRSGEATQIGQFPTAREHDFTPPQSKGVGDDWVLVLDDVGRRVEKPGKIS